jgi:hypothetical protein
MTIYILTFLGGVAANVLLLRATRNAPAQSLRGRLFTVMSGGGPGPVIIK